MKTLHVKNSHVDTLTLDDRDKKNTSLVVKTPSRKAFLKLQEQLLAWPRFYYMAGEVPTFRLIDKTVSSKETLTVEVRGKASHIRYVLNIFEKENYISKAHYKQLTSSSEVSFFKEDTMTKETVKGQNLEDEIAKKLEVLSEKERNEILNYLNKRFQFTPDTKSSPELEMK